jgi:predicted nucleotidyltransferase
MISLPQSILSQISKELAALHPSKVVLFGSRARGRNVREDSDIDLLVVLDEERAPNDYSEKMKRILSVRKALLGVNKMFSLDTLVFTRQEWETFRSLRPEMVADIERDGIILQ